MRTFLWFRKWEKDFAPTGGLTDSTVILADATVDSHSRQAAMLSTSRDGPDGSSQTEIVACYCDSPDAFDRSILFELLWKLVVETLTLRSDSGPGKRFMFRLSDAASPKEFLLGDVQAWSTVSMRVKRALTTTRDLTDRSWRLPWNKYDACHPSHESPGALTLDPRKNDDGDGGGGDGGGAGGGGGSGDGNGNERGEESSGSGGGGGASVLAQPASGLGPAPFSSADFPGSYGIYVTWWRRRGIALRTGIRGDHVSAPFSCRHHRGKPVWLGPGMMGPTRLQQDGDD